MKNLSNRSSLKDSSADIQAKKAIQRIQKWVEKKYPLAATAFKTRLIVECLIELTEEKKYMAAH